MVLHLCMPVKTALSPGYVHTHVLTSACPRTTVSGFLEERSHGWIPGSTGTSALGPHASRNRRQLEDGRAGITARGTAHKTRCKLRLPQPEYLVWGRQPSTARPQDSHTAGVRTAGRRCRRAVLMCIRASEDSLENVTVQPGTQHGQARRLRTAVPAQLWILTNDVAVLVVWLCVRTS